MADREALRIMTKVARLYHVKGLRQTEIADRVGTSQARVSRLLKAAEQAGVVRTVVVIPDGLHAHTEEALEERYGLKQVHVVEAVDGGPDEDLAADLGTAAVPLLTSLPLAGSTVGYTSWSRSLRALVAALEPVQGANAAHVVEMLGDVGPPWMQHEATRSTQRLAEAIGADTLFLRVPGVADSAEMADAIVERDGHAQTAIRALDSLDVALVGIGTCRVDPPLVPGDNFFTEEQFARAAELGAVGQVNLRFLDVDGAAIESELDHLVIGVSLAQLRAAKRRIAVAGGTTKYEAVRAAVRGRWIDTLVTDLDTAERLLGEPRG